LFYYGHNHKPIRDNILNLYQNLMDPAIRPLGSEKEPEQGGLAVPITADKSEPLARIHQKVDVIQQ